MKLGEHLLRAGVINDAKLRAGLEHAASSGERLGSALIELGHATGDQIAVALAAQHGVAVARDRQLASASGALVSKVPPQLARDLCAVVIGEGRDRELLVALEDPLDASAITALETATKRVVVTAAASTLRLEEALDRLYPPPVANDIAGAARGFAERESVRTARITNRPPIGDPLPPGAPVALGIAEATPAAEPPPVIPAPVDLRSEVTAKLTAPGAIATPLDLDDAREDAREILRDPLQEGASDEPADLEEEAHERRALPELHDDEADLDLPAMISAPPAPSPEMMKTPVPPRTSTLSGTPSIARTTTQIPPTRRIPVVAGGTSLAAPGSSSGNVGSALRYLIGFGVLAVVATLTYQRCTHDPSWSIAASYDSEFLRAKLTLPGPGWRGHESLRINRTNDGDRWARIEGFYRGGEIEDPAEVITVLRLHAPGAFPDEVDLEQFRGQIGTLSRQVIASAGNLQSDGLDCTLEPRVRPEPAGACRGPGTFRAEPVNMYMFYWEDTVDDIMAVIYIGKGVLESSRVSELEGFIREIQVE